MDYSFVLVSGPKGREGSLVGKLTAAFGDRTQALHYIWQRFDKWYALALERQKRGNSKGYERASDVSSFWLSQLPGLVDDLEKIFEERIGKYQQLQEKRER